jgi:hypothetical protein
MENGYAQKYFDLANGITGFAVIQMIAILVALGTSTDFAAKVSSACAQSIVTFATVIATIIYVAAVIACGVAELALLNSVANHLIRTVKATIVARVVAILLITGFGLFAYWHQVP